MLPLLFSHVLCSYPIGNDCKNVSKYVNCGDYLYCNSSGLCDQCSSDDQCDPRFYCKKSSDGETNICSYEPLNHKWDLKLTVGMISVFIAGIFVSGAGIGGGGLFVPIMMLIVQFPSSYAIPTSKAIIFGGSLSVTIFNLKKRHPYYDRPLINYNVASMIEPISWLGTIIGVIFNSVFPEWLLYTVQFFLLMYTAWSTFKKALSDSKKLSDQKSINEPIKKSSYDGPAYSKALLWTLLVIYVIFIIVSFLRGGEGTDSFIGIKFCSPLYWALTFGPFPIYLVINFYMIKIARRYPVLGDKADLKNKDLFALLMSGFAAGVAAGFLGIGGGMIKGPMMLALDIEAEEMAATSSLMILMTSSATSFQFVANGLMPWLEFVTFSMIGFSSFLIGIFFLRWLVKKTGSRSLFLYLLAAVIFISAILMSVVGATVVITQIRGDGSFGFRSFCT